MLSRTLWCYLPLIQSRRLVADGVEERAYMVVADALVPMCNVAHACHEEGQCHVPRGENRHAQRSESGICCVVEHPQSQEGTVVIVAPG